MSIKAHRVTRAYGDFVAVDDVSVEVATGELVALLGPSGSGKTTLLRIIAGLETSDHGQILLNDEDATSLSVADRRVGFVFQHYALFRHMTVFENVAFGLRVRPRRQRPSPAAIKEKVRALLQLVQLDWLADRYPHQLSGGQRQRIALARALAVEPKVLLLDEPFGALDAKVRKELRAWLRRLHDELHITSIFVTHDQDEALQVADRVVVLNHGKVEQVGTPQEVYEHPASPFVCEFLGDVNRFHGRIEDGIVVIGEAAANDTIRAAADKSALIYVRPHDIEITPHAGDAGTFSAVIGNLQVVGAQIRVELLRTAGGEPLQAELSREQYGCANFAVGATVGVRLKRPRIFPQHRDGAGVAAVTRNAA